MASAAVSDTVRSILEGPPRDGSSSSPIRGAARWSVTAHAGVVHSFSTYAEVLGGSLWNLAAAVGLSEGIRL